MHTWVLCFSETVPIASFLSSLHEWFECLGFPWHVCEHSSELATAFSVCTASFPSAVGIARISLLIRSMRSLVECPRGPLMLRTVRSLLNPLGCEVEGIFGPPWNFCSRSSGPLGVASGSAKLESYHKRILAKGSGSWLRPKYEWESPVFGITSLAEGYPGRDTLEVWRSSLGLAGCFSRVCPSCKRAYMGKVCGANFGTIDSLATSAPASVIPFTFISRSDVIRMLRENVVFQGTVCWPACGLVLALSGMKHETCRTPCEN